MSDTSIRVSEEAKHRLDLYKREGDSYEDVIMRLTDRDQWAGFGALSDSETDTKAGLDKIRAEMQSGMVDDIEDR
jgi:predicted CopG family antitoxin